jgi:hypothetical protein
MPVDDAWLPGADLVLHMRERVHMRHLLKSGSVGYAIDARADAGGATMLNSADSARDAPCSTAPN